LNNFILNKSIPGIESLYKSSTFIEFDFFKKKFLEINGKKYKNPILNLLELSNQIGGEYFKESGLYADFKALIHGDLTAENILVLQDGKIVLIDPLSTYMHSSKLENGSLVNNRTSVAYDFMKVSQSLYLGYENWSASDTSSNIWDDGSLWFDSSLSQVGYTDSFNCLKDLYSGFGVDVSDKNIDLLSACLLFRLIPYRLSANRVSAIYSFCLGTTILERWL
jgi:serine/threonine protein kinase